MKNKVTVTRAHRLRKCIYRQINVGDYYLADILDSTTDEYGILQRGQDSVCPHFTLPYELVLAKDEVIPFDSFDDMCKWVANGKRLEDLCDMEGDGVELGSFPKETRVAFIFRGNPFMLLANGTIFRLEEEGEYPFPNIHSIVYPLGAGDTITIEITE